MVAFMQTDTAVEITPAVPRWVSDDSPTDALQRPRPVARLEARTENERVALSVTEVAKLLGISRALAYELAARGDLPVLRLGRRIVVPRVALAALLGAERL
jgi:excisionase family DNA binding protein